MQWKMVAIVGRAKFDLCRPVFAGAWFVRTGATRFRFVDGYSGEGGTETRCSVPGFQPETGSSGSVSSLGVSVYACVTFGPNPGSISFSCVFAPP